MTSNITASSIAQWYSAGFECGRFRVQSPFKDFLKEPVYLQTLKDMTYSLNCICITMYTAGVLCLGFCYGDYFPGRLPQYQFIFKINNQFEPDILFEVSIISKDMYIISPFNRYVLFLNNYCNLHHICTRLQMV